MNIGDCVELFKWEIDLSDYQIIHDKYVNLLTKNLGYYLGNLKKNNLAKSEKLESILNLMSPEGYMRLLTSPEFSYRIFYKYENQKETYDFILNSVKAELLKERKLISYDRKVWTANGDYCYNPQNQHRNFSEYHSLKLAEKIPVDFISPHAMGKSVVFQRGKILYSDLNGPLYNKCEVKKIYSDLINAYEIIYLTNPKLGEIIRAFTKVLVIRKDPKSKSEFSSASAGQFTGRTLLANMHLDFVGHDVLAEAIVHETIHSIMYMLERETPWIKSQKLYFDSSILLKSPWSGNMLRIRPFMQATFVWYGILNFWLQIKKYSVVEDYIANYYINSAVKGFKTFKLTDKLFPWRNEIEPLVYEGMDKIQKNVMESFD